MLRRLLVLCVGSALFACPASDSVKASIGPAGGTLEHPQGAKLIVPAGALGTTVELSISSRNAPPPEELGAVPIGAAFVLGPEGQQFEQPVQVVLPYDPSQVTAGQTAEIRISPQAAPSYSALVTTADASVRRLTAPTTHFSIVVASATGAAQACTTLSNSGSVVSETRVAQAGPVPMGGTPVTGIYHLVSRTLFTGPGGATGATGKQRRQTLKVLMTGATSATLEVVEQDVAANTEVRSAGLVTLNGAQLSFSRTCPSSDSDTIDYSFSNDALELIEMDSGALRVIRFERQANLDAGVDDGGVMGACASVPLVGPTTFDQQVASAAPSPAGGAFESGTYVRVGATIFTGAGGLSGPTSSQRQQTLGVVANSATSALFEDATRRNQGAPEFRAYSATGAGSQLTLTQTCPQQGAGSVTAGYTLANGQLDVFEPSGANTRVTTFLKLLADGGVPPYDAGTSVMPLDAGSWTTVATGLNDVVDLDLDATNVYTLGGGEVRKCALAGCGNNTTLVTGAAASSIAVDNGTLWATTNFRTISTCSLSGTCTLVTTADLGANSYPAHLWVANARVYFVWEAGSSRRISVCPSGGCTTGYPKTVYAGAELDGLPVSGLIVTASDAYVSSYTGGIYRVTLTDPETATTATKVLDTDFGTGGFEADAITARWGVVGGNALHGCLLPACSSSMPIMPSVMQPSALRSDATHLYSATRGQSNGSGGWVANTATVQRLAK